MREQQQGDEESPDQRIDHLGLRLARAYQVFRREMLTGLQALGYTDLTSTHLLILSQFDGAEISVAALVERLGLSKQTVSRSLREMEKSRCIELHQDQGDRRAKTVHLSAKGQAILLASKPLKSKFQGRVIDRIGEQSFENLMDLLQAIEAEFGR